jgi:hypothetical protein
VQQRGHGEALGTDARQLWGVDPEHVGQHVRQILQQMKAIRHLAGRGRPKARRFRVGLRAVPHEDLHPGMGLQPLGHGRGFAVGEQGQGSPPGEVQQQRAIDMALAQGEIVDAEDLWGDHYGAGGATDHPQQGVPADGKAERLAQPRPSRPPELEADGEEACRQSPRPPRPGRHKAGQRGSACVEEIRRVIWACASSRCQVSRCSDVVLGKA